MRYYFEAYLPVLALQARLDFVAMHGRSSKTKETELEGPPKLEAKLEALPKGEAKLEGPERKGETELEGSDKPTQKEEKRSGTKRKADTDIEDRFRKFVRTQFKMPSQNRVKPVVEE
jgi:hypothetical protein